MTLQKPISFFDCETTGLSTTKDRIVEICIIKYNPDGTTDKFYSLVNPTINISEEVSAVHGITNEDVKDSPTFADIADSILEFLGDSDLGGYNILHYDIPLIFEEFLRAKKLFDYRKRRILDSYRIWTQYETRNLKGAVNRFLGIDLQNAHSAEADVTATAGIFFKQMEMWFDETEFDHLHNETTGLDKKLDLSGKFAKNEAGEVTLTFGKHSGKTVQAIFAEDQEYLRWIYEKAEMPSDTKMIAQRIYSKLSSMKKDA
jgi:DNA polymerase-3 subunit epsilon